MAKRYLKLDLTTRDRDDKGLEIVTDGDVGQQQLKLVPQDPKGYKYIVNLNQPFIDQISNPKLSIIKGLIIQT